VSYYTLQALCEVIACIALMASGAGAFGSFYFGRRLDQQKEINVSYHNWQARCEVLVCIMLMVSGVGALGSFFAGRKIDQQKEFFEKEENVVVSPNVISVNPRLIKDFILSVTNNLDYSIYEVCLEISIPNGDLEISHIKIDPLDKPLDEQNSSPRYWYIDYETKSGKIIKQVFSDHLKAHSTKEFSVKIDCTKCTEKSEVSLNVTSWEKSPSKFEVEHNKRSLPEKFEDLLTENPEDSPKEKTTSFMKIRTPEAE
jgi:hypothetical protein